MEFNRDAAKDLGRDIVTMCYKAVILALTILFILGLLALSARAADNCPLPKPVLYQTAGYRVVTATDHNNKLFTHLWLSVKYEDQVFVKHAGVAENTKQAVKVGQKWLQCLEKKAKKLPKPLKHLPTEDF